MTLCRPSVVQECGLSTIYTPGPVVDDNVGQILNEGELESLFEEKLVCARPAILGEDITLLRNVNINTRRGAVLTSEGAMSKARERAQVDIERSIQQSKTDATRNI